MEAERITTPFGRRRMTLASAQRQIKTSESKTGRTVDKWRVFRDAGDARVLLGLQDRALTVLNALLSFYPASDLSEEKSLIVFPSNAQLSLRANGIAGTTLRKNLAALVDAGLILRKDSPNGKRYARKGDGGAIEDAYGFNLAPLVARADELAAMAQQMEAERRRFRMIKDRVSIARRDVRKLISAAIEEGAAGDWQRAEDCFIGIVSRLPRRPAMADLETIAEELALLQEEVANMLESQLNVTKSDANAIGYGCHIQNSTTESSNELEPRFEKKQDEKSNVSGSARNPIKTFPLEMVLRGCPEIKPFGPGGSVANWRDLMAAAVSVRSMLGVSPSAYEEACEIMGQATAAAVLACIYERSGHINSAGGYLRDLTAKARRGEFSMGPMLMALIKGNGPAPKVSA